MSDLLPCDAIDILRATADKLTEHSPHRNSAADIRSWGPDLERVADCLETLAEQLDNAEDERYQLAGLLEDMAGLLEGFETTCRAARFAVSGEGGVPQIEVRT